MIMVWKSSTAKLQPLASNRAAGNWDIYTVPADGGDAQSLLTRPFDQFPNSWSPDGQILAYHEGTDTSGLDLWLLPLGGGPELGPERHVVRQRAARHENDALAFVLSDLVHIAADAPILVHVRAHHGWKQDDWDF